jgi:hypothetical protein
MVQVKATLPNKKTTTQSHEEANSRSACQESRHLLWNPKFHYILATEPHPEPDECNPNSISFRSLYTHQ